MVDKWINTTVIATESLLTKQEENKVCSQQMVAQISAQLSFVWTICQKIVDLFLLVSFKIKFEIKKQKYNLKFYLKIGNCDNLLAPPPLNQLIFLIICSI